MAGKICSFQLKYFLYAHAAVQILFHNFCRTVNHKTFRNIQSYRISSVSYTHLVEEELGILPCKNLFLRNRQKTTFFLLLMPGEKKFFTKDLSAQLGISRLSFAEPEFMEQYLGLTPGSVSVLGLMNDKDWYVDLLVDKELLDQEYMGCHPCMNTTSLKIKTGDIFKKFLKYTGHRYRVVSL